LLLVTDSVGDALRHIERYAVQQFGLTRRRLRPSVLLGERQMSGVARDDGGTRVSGHEDRCA